MVDERQFHDRFYEEEADAIYGSPAYRLVQMATIAFVLKQVADPKSKTAVSVGCGTGALELMLAPYFTYVNATDLSPKAIAIARQRSAGVPNLRFDVAAGLSSYSPQSFDCVFCLSVLHHLSEPAIAELLAGSNYVLKPGGILITLDPNIRRAVGLFKRFVPGAIAKYHSPDERDLNPERLAALCLAAGFAEASIHYKEFFLSVLCWLFPSMPVGLARGLAIADQGIIGLRLFNRFANAFGVVARTRIA